MEYCNDAGGLWRRSNALVLKKRSLRLKAFSRACQPARKLCRSIATDNYYCTVWVCWCVGICVTVNLRAPLMLCA